MQSKYDVVDLHRLATHVCPKQLHIDQVFAWFSKVQYLALVLIDLPGLEKAVVDEEVRSTPAEPKAGVPWSYNRIHEIRFGMALELAAHTLYSVAEIAAQVANKASEKKIQSSFNGICKSVRNGKALPELVDALGDLDWYGRVREIRTEWAHYSAPFVGGFQHDRSVCLYSERPPSERRHFQGKHVSVPIADLVNWIEGARRTTNRLAGYLIERWILPALDMEKVQMSQQRDENGTPLFEAHGPAKMRSVPVRELLREIGIPR